MSITKGVPVPTSYRRLHESKTLFNIHDRLMLVWMVFISITGFSIIGMAKLGIHSTYIYLILILISGAVLFTVARDVQTLDKTKLHILLFFRMARNKHITKKYVEPLDDLKKIVPIETVEETGLIRYLDNTSGVLIRYDPPRLADSDNDIHNTRVKNIVNSLYSQFTLQFISNSVVDIRKPLLDATTEAMKDPTTSKEITNHIYSLYEEAKEQRETVDIEFMLMVSIPKTNTTDEAEQMRAAFIQTVLKSFQRAGILARTIEDRNEVIQILRRQLC